MDKPYEDIFVRPDNLTAPIDEYQYLVDDGSLQYLSPLGWERLNLTGNYVWRSSAKIGVGKFRSQRPMQPA